MGGLHPGTIARQSLHMAEVARTPRQREPHAVEVLIIAWIREGLSATRIWKRLIAEQRTRTDVSIGGGRIAFLWTGRKSRA
jgi:hypothetical protein